MRQMPSVLAVIFRSLNVYLSLIQYPEADFEAAEQPEEQIVLLFEVKILYICMVLMILSEPYLRFATSPMYVYHLDL